MFEPIRQMLIKEFIQVFRDPRMKGMIFMMPVIQLLLFGYAVTTDVSNVATAVCDLDNSGLSRELISSFDDSGYFEIKASIDNPGQIGSLFDRGEVQAVLQINRGFEGELRAGKSAPLQIIVDGTDSNTAGIILNYTSAVTRRFSERILASRLQGMKGSIGNPASVNLETRAWFNDNLESRNFYVPGVIALLVMLITLMLTSMAVVREVEIGTMEQVMVTPISSIEFILGKTIPFALIGFIDVVLITVTGVFWFEVPIRGSLPLLFFATALYLMSSLGIGLLISTICRTQQQAMMSVFFFFFPAILLSGFIFPIANMPELIQWLTYVNPLRFFLVIVRGIFLKGVGTAILWPQMLALGLIGSSVLLLATRRFRKTLA